MYFLIYLSIAVRPFSAEELVNCLKRWRASNERAALTGMLLYKEGNFLQVLEGEESAVRALFADRISHDPRHHKLTVLLEGPIQEREFSDWSMGFRNLSDDDGNAAAVADLPGYSEFMNTELSTAAFAADPSRAQRLLRIFKQS